MNSEARAQNRPDHNKNVASPARRRIIAVAIPLIVGIGMALLPPPAGLQQYSWWYLSLFIAVIIGLVTEPLPGAAIGLLGVAVAATLGKFVLFSPAQLATHGFSAPNHAVAWALSGFSNTIVWLIAAAFIFAVGYEKTGLGRRIALWLLSKLGGRPLTLGYAVMIADLVLAPFMPSNTARSAGSIYPVIKNIPEFYQSLPNDPSARRIGSFLMWVAIASTSVTSSMFLTGLAPNVFVVAVARTTLHVNISWTQWFLGFLPVGIILLLATPLLTYILYPPEVKRSPEIPAWAKTELAKMGRLSRKEIVLLVLVCFGLVLWIFGASFVDATTVALLVVSLLVVTGTVGWNDIIGNKPAFNTLLWFGTLVALASGLASTGVVAWLAGLFGPALTSLKPLWGLMGLVALFFLIHYLFASLTAHAAALLPVMLTIAGKIPGLPPLAVALAFGMTLGIMGILTPYGTGPAPVYAGSGFLPSSDYWRLGAIFGFFFLIVFLVVGVPYLFYCVH